MITLYTGRFNIQQFYVLPTQCIYVFCVDLRINSDYLKVGHPCCVYQTEVYSIKLSTQLSFAVFNKVTYFDLIGYNEANICNMFSYV